jgi:hypothetical protein
VALAPDGSSMLVANTDGAVRILPTTWRGFLDAANRLLKH